MRVTETPGRQEIFTLTPEELLGPLNDVERKFAPQEIFAAGSMEIPLPRPRVAIVGSRKPSQRGYDAAAEIARTLSGKGVVIVSGLASGIDTAAHRAAIEVKGRAIAVLGTALNSVYPRENSQLQKEITTNHLAIVSSWTSHATSEFRHAEPDDGTDLKRFDHSRSGRDKWLTSPNWEALRLGRPLFVWKSIVNLSSLAWPEQMIRYGALKLDDPRRVLDLLPSPQRIAKISV